MTQNTAVGIFDAHERAEDAIRQLQHAGYDMTKLSIIGKDYHTEEHVVGYYNTGDRMKVWGKLGAFWGGLMGLLFGSAFLIIPGVGHVFLLGPVVSWLAEGLTGAALGGGVSALGAALFGAGIPKDSVLRYEVAVRANQFLVLAHGTMDEVQRAREILRTAGATDVDLHAAEGEHTVPTA